MTTYDFGAALSALRAGARVARRGWNGRGMWVVLQSGYPEGVPANAAASRTYGVEEGSKISIRPYLSMRTVAGDYVPWVASQTDLLAEDWYTAGQQV